MNLADWPLYVNDDGVVTCNYQTCAGEEDFLSHAPQRRITMTGFHDLLIDHIYRSHRREYEAMPE